MVIRYKAYSKAEGYATTKKVVKKYFSNDDVYIGFGYLSKFFYFDSVDASRPKICGMVIASGSFNNRDTYNEEIFGEPRKFIDFYSMNDPSYTPKYQTIFEEKYLPILHEWYLDMVNLAPNALPGVEQCLIAWDNWNKEFNVYRYRYH